MTSLSPTTVDSFETSIKEASKTPHLFGCTKHGRSGFENKGVGKVNCKLVLHVTKNNGFQHYPVQKSGKVSLPTNDGGWTPNPSRCHLSSRRSLHQKPAARFLRENTSISCRTCGYRRCNLSGNGRVAQAPCNASLHHGSLLVTYIKS